MALIWRSLSSLVLLGLFALTACTTQELRPAEQNAKNFAPWTNEIPPYRYGTGDQMTIRFLMTPEMDEDAMVTPDGEISLRAAGTLKAADRTQPELTQDITEKSRAILRNPQVTVMLTKAASAKVYVGGQVTYPNPYPIDGRTGVLEAITMAGGFTDQARLNEVVLIRRNKDNRPMLRTVNVQEFIETAATTGDVPLAPGDIIFVPRSEIAEVNLWIDQFIVKVLPFNSNFTYSIYSNTAPVW